MRSRDVGVKYPEMKKKRLMKYLMCRRATRCKVEPRVRACVCVCVWRE